jgi:hypothetical protein
MAVVGYWMPACAGMTRERRADASTNRDRLLVMKTAISIEEALKACALAGNGMVPGKAPVQSELKQECSLVGLAYLPSTMPSPAPT